jgi:hypothetical protein
MKYFLILFRAHLGILYSAALFLFFAGEANAQIYVTEYSFVSKYDNDGTRANADLISGFTDAWTVAASGSDLFVGDVDAGNVAEYTTNGAAVNSPLISGLGHTYGVAASGSELYVASDNANYTGSSLTAYTVIGGIATKAWNVTSSFGTPSIALSGSDIFLATGSSATGIIEEYTTSGLLVNSDLVSDLAYPDAIAASSSDLFVVNGSAVSEYSTSGTLVNSSLISFSPQTIVSGLAVSGSDLFVETNTNGLNGIIGEYTLSGAAVNASLVQGLTNGEGIAVQDVPEPSVCFLLVAGFGFLVFFLPLVSTIKPGYPSHCSLPGGPRRTEKVLV